MAGTNPPDNPESNAIIVELDLKELSARGRIRPGPRPGHWSIQRNEMYSRWYFAPPFWTPALGVAFMDMPRQLVSCETLQHVGFSPVKTAELWHRWTNRPVARPRPELNLDDGGLGLMFFHFFIGRLDALVDLEKASGPDDGWVACLNRLGIDQEWISVLVPLFERLRLTEPCVYRLKNIMQIKYNSLMMIQRVSRERAKAIQSALQAVEFSRAGRERARL